MLCATNAIANANIANDRVCRPCKAIVTSDGTPFEDRPRPWKSVHCVENYIIIFHFALLSSERRQVVHDSAMNFLNKLHRVTISSERIKETNSTEQCT